MSDEWPPEGYADPKEWERDDRVIGVVGVVLGVMFAYWMRTELLQLGLLMRANIVGYLGSLGIERGTPSYAPLSVFAGLFFASGLFIGFKRTILPLHERIHYRIADFYELNPEHVAEKLLLVENPGVVCVATNIPLWQSALVSLGPFVVIGGAAALVVFATGGIIAGVGAFVLVMNAVSSHGDVYDVVRFAMLPTGTLLANVEDGENGYRAEYAVPEEERT